MKKILFLITILLLTNCINFNIYEYDKTNEKNDSITVNFISKTFNDTISQEYEDNTVLEIGDNLLSDFS